MTASSSSPISARRRAPGTLLARRACAHPPETSTATAAPTSPTSCASRTPCAPGPSRSSRRPTGSSSSTRPRTTPTPNPGNGICATVAGECTLRAAMTEANRHAGRRHDRLQPAGQRAADDPDHEPAAHPERHDRPDDDRRIHAARLVAEHERRRSTTPSSTSRCAAPARRSRTTCSSSRSPNNVVRGLSIFNGRPMVIQSANAHNNHIVGNFIGTDAAGTFAFTTLLRNCAGIELNRGAIAEPHRRHGARRPQRDLGHRFHRRLLHRQRHERELRPEQHHRPQSVGDEPCPQPADGRRHQLRRVPEPDRRHRRRRAQRDLRQQPARVSRCRTPPPRSATRSSATSSART